MFTWDYHLPQNWKPVTAAEWEWFLVRKINYNDLEGLDKGVLKKHFPKIAKLLDPGKRMLLDYFLEHN